MIFTVEIHFVTKRLVAEQRCSEGIPVANDFDNYSETTFSDVRVLVELDDVMEAEDLRLGPNGGLVFCMEYIIQNFEWFQEKLGDVEDDYILFDCPGQIELYTHLQVMRQLVEALHQWDFRVCGVFLVDAQFMVECSKFFAGVLAALSAMIQLEIPHVNVMTKMDLLNKRQMTEVEKFLDPDARVLLDELGDGMSKKYKKLNSALASLIDDYSMVSFLPLNPLDEDSVSTVMLQIDNAIQYGEDLDVKMMKDQDDYDDDNGDPEDDLK